ncbi:hypothetical protein AAG906_017509 [Vitis piasezkii]
MVKKKNGWKRGTVLVCRGLKILRYFCRGGWGETERRVEACCKDEALERWSKGWEEGGRRFKLESHSNGAGEFWFCFVVAEEGNRFALIFCEGRGLHGGWVVLAEKLQSLGFIPLVETREVASLAKVRSKPRVVKDFGSFAELVRKDLGVVGDALWLQIGEREVLHREEFLMKNCVTNLWSLKMAVKVSTFGGALLLFEFEDKSKAERVLVRGSRRIKDNLLHLARWTLEAGCLLKSGVVKEVWVRVLGLPLHLWSQEVLKKIRDYCGGFVAMDDDTTFLSILLWARILVKSEGRVLPGLLQVVVGSFSFSIQLWWERVAGKQWCGRRLMHQQRGGEGVTSLAVFGCDRVQLEKTKAVGLSHVLRMA